jgi:hypothetical protein
MEIYFDANGNEKPDSNAIDAGVIHSFPTNQRWLFVVDAIDQAGGRHQLQLLKEAGVGNPPITAKMVHSLGETFGEGITKRVRRAVEILMALKAEVRKLFR